MGTGLGVGGEEVVDVSMEESDYWTTTTWGEEENVCENGEMGMDGNEINFDNYESTTTLMRWILREIWQVEILPKK